jgi:hypothetical protein
MRQEAPVSSTVHQHATGVTDECIRCAHLIEFSERERTYAWRHLSNHTCACDEPSPEHLSLRVITDRFLEEQP